jgi:hypothetical protein
VGIEMNGSRRSTGRRTANRSLGAHVDSMAQGVAQLVIDPVVESLDLNALIARVDVNQVVDRVDINAVLDRVDMNSVLDHLDMNKLLANVDINELLGRIDIETLVKDTDIGELLASSSRTVASEAVDLGRSHAVSMDDTLARWVSRLRRRRTAPAVPTGSPTAQEKP